MKAFIYWRLRAIPHPTGVNCCGRAGSRCAGPNGCYCPTLTVIVVGELASSRHLLAPDRTCQP